jgi:hypothetical protein
MGRSPTTISASPAEDRGDELGDVLRLVLVVGVGVDDDVRALLDAGVEAGHERLGEAPVPRHADDVIGPVGARHLDGAVGGPVVDDEPFHHVDAGKLPRQRVQRRADGGLLVETRDLDDQLAHHAHSGTILPRRAARRERAPSPIRCIG